ncbi:hypothetical protein LTS18_003919 [Coniosporium uncinatum]|uniref:Uncharacterized protein n=1 Tax=Coniosporium uncinatum TaxID=93489 RepID=A0ACC3DBP8_9PEZI|nr:hypothetical protein LTS18_003919 [Coniosporium uncinatum]
MKSWLSDYNSALDVRDARDKAQSTYINAYTKLADRTAQLTSTLSSQSNPAAPTPASPATKAVRAETSAKARSPLASPFGRRHDDRKEEDPTDTLTRLRADLAATQKSRADLQAQLKPLSEELSALKTQRERDKRSISILEKDKLVLERKVRDREEEIKMRKKLVEDVQDEMVSLGLELSMSAQQQGRLKGENEELVRRWVEYKGKEAERWNEGSGWS